MKDLVKKCLFNWKRDVNANPIDRLSESLEQANGLLENLVHPIPKNLFEKLKGHQNEWVDTIERKINPQEYSQDDIDRFKLMRNRGISTSQLIIYEKWEDKQHGFKRQMSLYNFFNNLYNGKFIHMEVIYNFLKSHNLSMTEINGSILNIPDFNLNSILKFNFKHDDNRIDLKNGTTLFPYMEKEVKLNYVDYKIITPYYNEWVNSKFGNGMVKNVAGKPDLNKLGSCYIFIPVSTNCMPMAGYVLITSWDQD